MRHRLNSLSNPLHQPKQKEQKKLTFKKILLGFVVMFLVSAISIYSTQLRNTKVSSSKKIIKVAMKQTNIKTKKVASVLSMDTSLDPAIDEYLTNLHFNGTALVVKNGKVILNKGYGYSDMEKKIHNNPDTVFFIASITKVFVSTAIMQLQEQGKLNVHDSLSKYIPDFPNGHEITLYNLLTHTSGIPQHSETSQKVSHAELIKKIEQGHLRFKPGTQWLYSDSNYSILAYIVEKVSKQPFDDYIEKNIFEKAGMTNTGFGNDYYNQPYPSVGYRFKHNKLISLSLPDMSELFGCGDIYTTPYNMYLFDKALYSGKLMSQNSLKEFFTPFKHDYAFGMFRDPGSYSDHGVLSGWNTLNSFSLSGKTYVVLFSNIENGVSSFGLVNNHIYELVHYFPA